MNKLDKEPWVVSSFTEILAAVFEKFDNRWLDNAKHGIPSQGGGGGANVTFNVVILNERIPPLGINNLQMKLTSDRAKTVACIMPTIVSQAECRSWPWPFNPDSKSIGFLLSLPTTYMWSLKVIWQNSVSCPQKVLRAVQKLILTFDPMTHYI